MKILDQEIKNSSKKNAKRVGRGISAGGGKTAGRGTKGQKSRAGHNIPRQFEGGQTNLSMRLPKLKGFSGIRTKKVVITLDQLNSNFSNGDTVNEEKIIKLKLASKGDRIKIVANGSIDKKLVIDHIKISKSAAKMIEKASATKEEAKTEEKTTKAEDALKSNKTSK